MSNSNKALAAGLGFIALLFVVIAVYTRVGMTAVPAFSGERSTLTPALADFTGVEINRVWAVTVARGDAWRVEIDVPVELADAIDARVKDGRLMLGLKDGLWFRDGGFSDRGRLEATITMPALREAHLSGASDLDFSGFDGPELTITSSGSSSLEGDSSRYDNLQLTLSGSSKASLDDVTVTNAEVSVSGAGSASLRMDGGRLTGNLSGASSLVYSGTTSEQSVSASGASRVTHND
jgi:hypothetical protein